MKVETTLNVIMGAAIVGVLGYALYLVKKNGAAGAGAAVGAAVGDAGVGFVTGLGSSLGIPQTNQTECQKAIAEGRTWDASFACPAGTFLSSLFSSKPTTTASSGTTDSQDPSTDSGGMSQVDPGTAANLYDPLGWVNYSYSPA